MYCRSRFSSFVVLVVVLTLPTLVHAQDWPQWRGPERNGVWNETEVRTDIAGTLEPMWRVEIGAGYSGPTVADGKVYVMDRIAKPNQIERVLCFDAEDGNPIWEKSYDCKYFGIGYPAGPRASVTINDGLAYSHGTMGNLFCLNAKTGDTVWSKDLNVEYKIQVLKNRSQNRMPAWGMTCSPIIYDNLVILQIGANEAGVVAFNKKTGDEVWRATSDEGQYSSPVLTRQNNQDLLICWTGENVCGLNPKTGDVHWSHSMKARQMPIGCASPVVHDNRVFVSSFYDGSLMLKLSDDSMQVEEVWREVGQSETQTKSLHAMIGTPVIIDQHIYGVDSHGELRCLKADTGERVWEDLTAVPKARWSTIHMVQNDKQVWMFNERGEIVIAELSPDGFKELARAKIIEPTTQQLPQRGGVCWSHPAFAMQSVFARNDEELVRVDLKKK